MRSSVVRLGLVLALAIPACTDDAPVVDVDPAAPSGSQDGVATRELKVELGLASGYAAGEAVVADVKITNISDHKLKLLTWFVPGDEAAESLFVIERNGVRVDYIGPHYKRVKPEQEHFIQLKAGETLVRHVDLGEAYDLSATADYSVRFEVDTADLLQAGTTTRLASNLASAWIEARTAPTNTTIIEATVGSVSFANCTSSQQSDIVAAHSGAQTLSAQARDYLGGTPSGTPRYTTWFGGFSSGGWNTARTHFVSIADAFATQAVVVNCKCKKKNVYAYVTPSSPYNITVCGAFWPAPTIGPDSKAGTLIHEMSHFNVVSSTNDWAYGQTACKSLAQSDPSKALDNADSHEYFAENPGSQP